MAINDALPFKAAGSDAIAKLKSFGALNLSCRQTQCRFVWIRRGTQSNPGIHQPTDSSAVTPDPEMFRVILASHDVHALNL